MGGTKTAEALPESLHRQSDGSKWPDLVVVSAEADGNQLQTRYGASDLLLAVEVVSPDSEDRDRDTKPHTYAAAGIQHFWLVEMVGDGHRPMVITYELDPVNKTYVSTGVHHDRLKLSAPVRHRHRPDLDRRAVGAGISPGHRIPDPGSSLQ